jgi:hypothetical protein
MGSPPACRRPRVVGGPFIGVECFVGDQHAGLHIGQQLVRAGEVMSLTAGQVEPNGIAKGIHQGMDFRAQSTT